MTTQHTNYNCVLPRKLDQVFPGWLEQFRLLDVGASGGVELRWLSAFGQHLHAIGIDPLVNEIKRLNAQNKNPNIHYIEGYATSFQLAGHKAEATYVMPRTSSHLAIQKLAMDYVKDNYNSGQDLVLSDRRIEVDGVLSDHQIREVDFIKVDTDGHDFPVLLGAKQTLSARQVLGIQVEVQFHGAASDTSNTFANIDRFLRSHGFRLFDLDVYRYSRAALPAPFLYDIPAATISGQLRWGEALYLRDFVDEKQVGQMQASPSEQTILKMACLFELFGLPDCAVELLLSFSDRCDYARYLPDLLNALTPQLNDEAPDYEVYHKVFEADPRTFYPSNRVSTVIEKAAEVAVKPALEPKLDPVPESFRIGHLIRAIIIRIGWRLSGKKHLLYS